LLVEAITHERLPHGLGCASEVGGCTGDGAQRAEDDNLSQEPGVGQDLNQGVVPDPCRTLLRAGLNDDVGSASSPAIARRDADQLDLWVSGEAQSDVSGQSQRTWLGECQQADERVLRGRSGL